MCIFMGNKLKKVNTVGYNPGGHQLSLMVDPCLSHFIDLFFTFLLWFYLVCQRHERSSFGSATSVKHQKAGKTYTATRGWSSCQGGGDEVHHKAFFFCA